LKEALGVAKLNAANVYREQETSVSCFLVSLLHQTAEYSCTVTTGSQQASNSPDAVDLLSYVRQHEKFQIELSSDTTGYA